MSIDRVARQMVDIEPSADLEARIRARLGEARPAHTAGWWVWRVGAPLATAAALAAVFVVQGPESRVQDPQTAVSTSQPSNVSTSQPSNVSTSQLPKLATSQPSAVASRLPNFSASRLSKVPASRLSAEEIAWMDRRIPALDPVNALQIDRLRADWIQPEPLAITPLTMTPVGTDGAGIVRRNDR